MDWMEWILKYWIEIVFGVVVSFVGAGFRYIYKRMKSQADEQKAFKNGLKVLIRDRIINAYNKALDRGYCPIYSLESVHALHEQYKALGGNGAMDEIMNKIRALPTQPSSQQEA